jgi:hypothetical protein
MYMHCISQLIRYARACSTYDQFLIRGNLLTNKLRSQGFQQNRLQTSSANFVSLQRSSLPLQPSFWPHAVWCVSYQSLSRSWHTDQDYNSYHLPGLETRLTSVVTCRQGILTPPGHLIPCTSDIFRGPCLPILWFVFRLLFVIYAISYLI